MTKIETALRCVDEARKPCIPCEDCGYVAGRPVENCGHVADDGTCKHPKNLTPECHDYACPLLSQLAEARQAVIEAVNEYRQAIKDHADDPCQCIQYQEPHKCNGDCGPANAVTLLNALSRLRSLEHPRPEGEGEEKNQ